MPYLTPIAARAGSINQNTFLTIMVYLSKETNYVLTREKFSFVNVLGIYYAGYNKVNFIKLFSFTLTLPLNLHFNYAFTAVG